MAFSLDGVSLTGRVAVVTGATSGIGLETALGLARLGALVFVAGRRQDRGAEVVAQIEAAGGRAAFLPLDLSDLASVARFADAVTAAAPAIDLLINNAGILAVPTRALSIDGFELQFGTNFLGHFALTMALLPALLATPAPRVVSISSISHRHSRIRLNDLRADGWYSPWRAYAHSKLAMLVFALELQRRAEAAGWTLRSMAAHPGLAATELPRHGPGVGLARRSLNQKVMTAVLPYIGQSAAGGAQPSIVAAALPDLPGGSYLGPTGLFEWRGPLGNARIGSHARDVKIAAGLWQAAERLTGRRPPAMTA